MTLRTISVTFSARPCMVNRFMSLALERLVAGTPTLSRVIVSRWSAPNWPRVSARRPPAGGAGQRRTVADSGGDQQAASVAIERAAAAFSAMSAVSDQAISEFFDLFAQRLESPAVWDLIAGRQPCRHRTRQSPRAFTTRLLADERMRRDMIAGLRAWRDAPASAAK